MKTKIGTEIAHVTRNSDTIFKVKRSKVNLQGAGAYCGGLPHSLLAVQMKKLWTVFDEISSVGSFRPEYFSDYPAKTNAITDVVVFGGNNNLKSLSNSGGCFPYLGR